MTEDQVNSLFCDLENVARNLKGALLTAVKNGAVGRLAVACGDVTAEIGWPYPYGDHKLDLRLEIKAEIPRKEEA